MDKKNHLTPNEKTIKLIKSKNAKIITNHEHKKQTSYEKKLINKQKG